MFQREREKIKEKEDEGELEKGRKQSKNSSKETKHVTSPKHIKPSLIGEGRSFSLFRVSAMLIRPPCTSLVTWWR